MLNKKTYVLDTNVLLSDPNSIMSFEENDLIIPMIVLEELDKHKSRQDEVGANARQISRLLDSFRSTGSLLDGVTLASGGTLKVVSIFESDENKLPIELERSKVDNMIIAFMLSLKTQNIPGILVSKDINVRLKCDSLNIQCEDYRKTKLATDPQKFYRGVEVVDVSQELVSEFFVNHALPITKETFPEQQFYPNQIVVIKSTVEGSSRSAITKCVDNELIPVRKIDQAFGLKPRNKEQGFSLDLLFDQNIKLLTLTGPSGCVIPSTKVKLKIDCLDRNIPHPDDTYDNEPSED